jgi:hypothetical protein
MMTFTGVKTHFEANRAHPADLNWDDLYRLSPAEARAVRASLQTFQRGEGTGGNHLLALATQWQWEEPDYAATMQLFIQKEKGHADMLGQFMVQQGIPRLETYWLHEIFRRLGRPLGLEHMVRVDTDSGSSSRGILPRLAPSHAVGTAAADLPPHSARRRNAPRFSLPDYSEVEREPRSTEQLAMAAMLPRTDGWHGAGGVRG